MPTIYIDGQPVELDGADNLLEALLAKGVDLPYFCWHPAMGSVGACRQCAVLQYRDENDKQGRIVMSCMTPVTPGARFSVDADNARVFRASVVENLMINHPHDCPVCEEGGECHLQDMTVMTGHSDRKYRHQKTTFRNQYLGPLIGHEMNRCITCYRCVRYYQDYAGGDDLAAFASRDRVFFGREADGVLQNEFAGNLVEVCPTGVFTDKPLSAHYTRKWDLQSAPSVCVGCSLGCNTTPSERYGELRRIQNRYNHRVNGYFLCDRGRYGGEFVNDKARIPYIGIRNKANVFEAVHAHDGVAAAARLLDGHVVGIGSPRASLEANFVLRQLVGAENFYAGANAVVDDINHTIVEILSTTRAQRPSLLETENYDAVLILGEDTTNHAPRLALSLRQATRLKARELADKAQIPQWHDAAVRKIGQSDFSPLIVATPYGDRLDDVASLRIRETPDNIAQLGYRIANALNGDQVSGDVGKIVNWLREAKRPLIVSGSSLQNVEVIKAAANIANALASLNDQAGIFLCPDECNSIGVTALSDSRRGLEQLIGGRDIDTAIVLENDLSLRISPSQLSQLRNKIRQLIVIDHLDNLTTSMADIVFPAATFAESEATFINNEATAQRAFSVFIPKDEIAPSWHWLSALGQAVDRAGFDDYVHVDAITAACEAAHSNLEGIVAAAPGAAFRIRGARVPRMTHRYSGRTAMLANVSVHEPMQPDDDESSMAFTMEGSNVNQPSALRPYTWSPGWNSNQSINKFQEEIGGALKGGDPGVRVIRSSGQPAQYQAAATMNDQLPLVPRHHIFGSEELSARGQAIGSLTPRAYVTIHPNLADSFGVSSGDGLQYAIDGETRALEVIVDETVADGCICYAFALPETRALANTSSIAFSKAEGWTRRESRSANVITTDRRQ